MENEGFWSPYLAGLGIGLVLIATILITGWGLGASTAFSVLPALTLNGISPDMAEDLDYFARYLERDIPWLNWYLFLAGGVILGSFIGAKVFKKFETKLDKPKSMSTNNRIIVTLGGGMIMGFSARLAGGCASGLALSGGAQLALAGWIFVMAMFASGFLFAFLFRRLWS